MQGFFGPGFLSATKRPIRVPALGKRPFLLHPSGESFHSLPSPNRRCVAKHTGTEKSLSPRFGPSGRGLKSPEQQQIEAIQGFLPTKNRNSTNPGHFKMKNFCRNNGAHLALDVLPRFRDCQYFTPSRRSSRPLLALRSSAEHLLNGGVLGTENGRHEYGDFSHRLTGDTD